MTRPIRTAISATALALMILTSAAMVSTTSPIGMSPIAEENAPCTELAPTLLRLGLGAEAMTAAGCSAQDVATAAASLDVYLLADPGAIPAADQAWATANQAVEALKRKIKSGLASEVEVASLPGLQATLSTAATARDGLIAAANAVSKGALSAPKSNMLTTILGNSGWSLPTYCLTVDRTQEDWVGLRNALDEQRIAAKYEEEVSPASLAIIGAALGDATVAAAKVNLDTNLAAMEAAWNAATE